MLADLKRSVGEDLLQEMRAAGLRLEGTLHKRISERVAEEAARADLDGFSPEQPPKPELTLPMADPLEAAQAPDSRRLWNAFRSPKHFFEKDGRTALRSELEKELFEAADRALAETKELWSAKVEEAFGASLLAAADGAVAELAAFAEGIEQALGEPGEERMWAEIQQKWAVLRSAK
ncbi:hypothetical protein [Cohnella algarum]|uniref:hypothetical protein n=1 Tax=Cohnella algarum TaxID=2044859 RepID=UPI00196870B2|nr:hypothetical protein [Cohnella algarum]MBN2984012.1 hypothetical protein [Cohnella algarum]